MSKKVYKKVSFIIPELDVSGKGKISKEVYRKLIKYGKSLLETPDTEVVGSKVYVNNEIDVNSFNIDDGEITLLDENIVIEVNGVITVIDYVEGDRIDIEIPFETGITVEDKVALSFEGLENIDLDGYYTKDEIDSMVGNVEATLDAILGVWYYGN